MTGGCEWTVRHKNSVFSPRFFPMAGEWKVGREIDGRIIVDDTGDDAGDDAVDDAGEAVTLADATGGAWVFHEI